MSFQATTTEAATGALYGDLWTRYDDRLFRESVELFRKRWEANGEPEDFFKGKRCLDAGCGGGRYSIGMSLMGAESVVGVDVSATGIEDARLRRDRLGIGNVDFRLASVLDLPLPDGEFDFVCCSGVLHHTPGVERGLRELHRVLKPGGAMYLLLYGAGGLFWPSVLLLRPLAAAIGRERLDGAVESAKLSANQRRSMLDDYFVPQLETYSRERVEFLLSSCGFGEWRYWTAGRMDHESDVPSMIRELENRLLLWSAAAGSAHPPAAARQGHRILSEIVDCARALLAEHQAGRIGEEELRQAVIGHGHHRLVARRV